MAMGDPDPLDFVDATDVDLIGVMNAVAVTIPHLPEYGSIIVTGSTAAMLPNTTDNPAMGPGSAGYGWAKSTLMATSSRWRCTSRRGSSGSTPSTRRMCNTHLLHNDGLYSMFRPDLEHPTREDVIPAFTYFQAMPIPYVEPVDISNLVLFLASDEARYITGQQIRVDAGSLLKFPNGPGK